MWSLENPQKRVAIFCMNPGGVKLKRLLNIHCGSSHHLHSMVNYMDHTFVYLNDINNIITSLPMYVRVHVWVFIAQVAER